MAGKTLEARGLDLRVGTRTLMARTDLRFAPGECWALLAPNGAGKTQLLHALAGLVRPAGGTVRLDGDDLAARSRASLAADIGILLQDEAADWWGSVREYVALGCLPQRGWSGGPGTGRATADALAEFELESLADRPLRTLSGGERQRARIAQLAAQGTTVRLLDEPFNHLDLSAAALVIERLVAWARDGCTVVLSLHDPAWALRHCSHALLLYDSAPSEQGPAASVITPAAMEKLYRRRLDWLHDTRPARLHYGPPFR